MWYQLLFVCFLVSNEPSSSSNGARRGRHFVIQCVKIVLLGYD